MVTCSKVSLRASRKLIRRCDFNGLRTHVRKAGWRAFCGSEPLKPIKWVLTSTFNQSPTQLPHYTIRNSNLSWCLINKLPKSTERNHVNGFYWENQCWRCHFEMARFSVALSNWICVCSPWPWLLAADGNGWKTKNLTLNLEQQTEVFGMIN